LVILHKVALGKENTILLYFSDLPDWNKNTIIHKISPKNYYEVIEIKMRDELSSIYWILKRYIGVAETCFGGSYIEPDTISN